MNTANSFETAKCQSRTEDKYSVMYLYTLVKLKEIECHACYTHHIKLLEVLGPDYPQLGCFGKGNHHTKCEFP